MHFKLINKISCDLCHIVVRNKSAGRAIRQLLVLSTQACENIYIAFEPWISFGFVFVILDLHAYSKITLCFVRHRVKLCYPHTMLSVSSVITVVGRLNHCYFRLQFNILFKYCVCSLVIGGYLINSCVDNYRSIRRCHRLLFVIVFSRQLSLSCYYNNYYLLMLSLNYARVSVYFAITIYILTNVKLIQTN